ncbi:MAG: hypothetical protein AABY07_06445 [Nanoarchaeota archaeon]
MNVYKNKKIEYGRNSSNSMYIRKEECIKSFYQSKRNFSGRCCKTISSEPCLCNGQHCMRAF